MFAARIGATTIAVKDWGIYKRLRPSGILFLPNDIAEEAGL
jgi:hypothetical protein